MLLRAVPFLLVATSLGVFTALLSGATDATVASVATPFIAGLCWLGCALVCALRFARTPHAELATAALWLLGTGWLLEGVLPRAFAIRAFGGAALLHFVGAPRHRLALLGYLLPVAGWLVAPAIAEPLPLAAAAGIALVGRARSASFTLRRQATWLAAGLTVGLVAALPGLPVGARALVGMAVPAAVTASIAKYRLLDADAIISGAALDLMLAAPWVAALVWLRAAAPDPWLLATAGTLAAAAWWVVRASVRGSRAHDLTRVEGLADEIRRAEHLAHALGRLCGQLRGILGLHGARYLLHEGGGLLRPFSEAGADPPIRLRAQGRLLAYAGAFGAPVFVDDLRAEPLDVAEEGLLTATPEGTALLVPCRAGPALAGLLQIGPRTDGRPIDPGAYRALARLGERLGDLVDPLWWLDRQTAHLRAERALVDAGRVLTLATAARDLARRLRPALRHLRTRAATDAEAADLLPELEALTTDLVVAEAPGERAVFDVSAWLEETADLLLPEAEIHLVALQVDSEELRIEGDADHLRLALRLLAGNALVALAKWPGPRQIAFRAHAVDGSVLLSVGDSGPPRAPATDRPWSDPRGLRAATAERVARQHGGRLEIASAADGVVATIVLPSLRLA